MATFYNQARLTLGETVINSNQTEGEILSQVRLCKTAVSTNYGPGDSIVYAVTLVNDGNTTKSDVSITDNLGEFSPGGVTVVPLSYVNGSVIYFLNGVEQPAPTVTPGPPLVISGLDIPANGNAIILYEVRANEYAPRGANARITNEATATGDELCDGLADTAVIPTRDEPILSIAKAIYPETVSCGEEVTYTFIIQNFGNTAVVATDNLIVSDNFAPALNNITVRLNGTTLAEGVEYSYDEETGIFSTLGGAIPVPAATFERDAVTGIVNTTPGVATLTVTGTI
ncbi:MAG: hypothetical protein J6V80_07055 [Clostridia bacterium]|nr:hypothetical protein [Clostridia bacterium]